MTSLAPPRAQVGNPLLHLQRHLDGAKRGIRTGERVIEKDHQRVAGEALQRPLEFEDQLAQLRVELAQNTHHLLGLRRLRECGEASQVAEHDRDLAPMALEHALVVARDDDVGELRRQESQEPAEALQLVDLSLHPALEGAVQLRELPGLGLDGVVVLLDAEQGPYACKELRGIEWPPDEVVGTCLDGAHLVLVATRREHDDREHAGGGIRPQLAAHVVAAHLGHDDVEQDQIHRLSRDALERFWPGGCSEHRVAVGAQDRVHEPAVLVGVIDDEDAGGAFHGYASASGTGQ